MTMPTIAVRDASRIRIYWPDIDIVGDNIDAVANTDGYVCVTGNVSWGGFKRQSIKTTCTETAVDGWGNIVHTYRAGRFIDMGTLTFDVDFDPTETSVVVGAFRNTANRTYRIDFPPEGVEVLGPRIALVGHFTDFTPLTNALSDGDDARSRATLVLKLSGDWVITNATLV